MVLWTNQNYTQIWPYIGFLIINEIMLLNKIIGRDIRVQRSNFENYRTNKEIIEAAQE